MSSALGTVLSLHRYPVKSMLGEEVELAQLTDRGLDGDRVAALVDRHDGSVASAKHPRKWGRLLQCGARVEQPRRSGRPPMLRLRLGDGTSVSSCDADVDALVSRYLGRAVTLTADPPPSAELEKEQPDLDGALAGNGAWRPGRSGAAVTRGRLGAAAPPGTFFDYAPLHLLTTATLRRLSRVAAGARWEASRFRPNLVVDLGDAEGFVENGWAGREVTVGRNVRLRVLLPTPRCVVPALAHGRLQTDTYVLSAVVRHNRVEIPGVGKPGCAGVYAVVVRPGIVHRGDLVTVV